MRADFEILLIAALVAAACSVGGVFLVLRKMSMMADAITHTILLGIVAAFFLTGSLSSPLLIVGAAAVGVLTVFLAEALNDTGLVSEDSAIGVVFPLLFSVAVIIISRYADSVHLDTDSVLLGELAYAPFERLVLWGRDMGPKAAYTAGVILLCNLGFIALFFKELKIITFDAELAAILGFMPALIHYALMALVSVTAVGAFESVGSILVIAFMIGPPSTAGLLTNDLKKLILISGITGVLNAFLGYQAAVFFDVSIAGSMAVATGFVFALAFVFSPEKGLLTVLGRRRRQKVEFREISLILHIYYHEGSEDERVELGVDSIGEHINWKAGLLDKILNRLIKEEKLYIKDKIIKLTERGRAFAADKCREITLGIGGVCAARKEGGEA